MKECIIDKLIEGFNKVGTTLDNEDPRKLERDGVLEKLKALKGMAAEKTTEVKGTALDPSKEITDEGGNKVPFIYKGKEYKTLAKAIDKWVEAGGNVGRNVEDVVAAYLEANPSALTVVENSAGRYFQNESKWKNNELYEDALANAKLRELISNGYLDVLNVSSKSESVLGKKFEPNNAKIPVKTKNSEGKEYIKMVSIRSLAKNGITDVEYKKLWIKFVAANPEVYQELKDEVKSKKLKLVDTFAAVGRINHAEVLQNMIDTDYTVPKKVAENVQSMVGKKADTKEYDGRVSKEQTAKDADRLEC